MTLDPGGLSGGMAGGILERQLRTSEDQARAAGAMVEIQRQNGERLNSLEEITRDQSNVLREQTVILQQMSDGLSALGRRFDQIGQDTKEGRELAVRQVVTATEAAIRGQFQGNDGWWRRAFALGIGLIVLAQIVGVALDRILPVIQKLKP